MHIHLIHHERFLHIFIVGKEAPQPTKTPYGNRIPKKVLWGCTLLNINHTSLREGNANVTGLPLTKGNLKQIRQQMGYVFQDSDSQLFMSTIFEDVAFAPRNYGYNREETERMVIDALKQVGLENCRDKHVYKLSGGEKKLASIATVLAMQSKLMLLDEPTVGLDPRNRRRIIQVLNQLPCAKIIASHDLDFIYDTCQRVILLSEKGIAATGTKEEVLRNQQLLESHGLELPLSFSRIKE